MKFGLYISGKYVETTDYYDLINPYNDEVIAEVADGTARRNEEASLQLMKPFKSMKRLCLLWSVRIYYLRLLIC